MFPRLTVSPAEWAIAHQFLDKAPDGTKLPYTAIYDANGVLRPRSTKYIDRFHVYQTTHSFVKIQGVIYAVAPGKGPDAIVGQGHFGKTKYLEDEKREPFVSKIENKEGERQFFEAFVLRDRSLLVGKNKLQNQEKYYTIMPYLGASLGTLLKTDDPSLTEEVRLEALIELGWAIHQLHHGVGSFTKMPLAHRDIKPENVTRDATGHFRLVDFNLASELPSAKIFRNIGTPLYLPPTDDNGFIPLTKAQSDVFGLKRICYLPAVAHSYAGLRVLKDGESAKHSLFTKERLIELGLFAFVDTGSILDEDPPEFANDVTTAAGLSALGICAKLQLNVSYVDVNTIPWLGLTIAGLYFMGYRREAIQTVIANPDWCKLFAALIELNQEAHIKKFETDVELMKMIATNPSLTSICAYIQLDLLKQKKHQRAVLASETKAQAIMALRRMRVSSKAALSRVITDESFASLIITLEKYDLGDLYEKALNSVPLFLAMQKMIANPTLAMGLSVFHHRHIIKEDDILKICRNEEIAAALIRLQKFGLSRHARAVMYNNVFLRAFSAAKTFRTACAIVLVQSQYAERAKAFFAKVLADQVLVAAICILDKYDLIQYMDRVFNNAIICYAIANLKDEACLDVVEALLELDPAKPVKSVALTKALQRFPSAFAAAKVLLTADVHDVAHFIHVVADAELVEMVICLQAHGLNSFLPQLLNDMAFRRLFFLVSTDKSVAACMQAILNRFQHAPYATVLSKAEEDEEFEAAFKMAAWELDDAAQLIAKKENKLLSNILARAKTKEEAVDYVALLVLIDQWIEIYTQQVRDKNTLTKELCSGLVSEFKTLMDDTCDSLSAAQAFISSGKRAVANVLLVTKHYPDLTHHLNLILLKLEDLKVYFSATFFCESKEFYGTFFKSRQVILLDDAEHTHVSQASLGSA